MKLREGSELVLVAAELVILEAFTIADEDEPA